MDLQDKKFVSYIESRIQTNNELYARFHLGNFASGQALTIANALRRTLLSEIPAFIITKVQIEGIRHEFDSIPDIQENILDVLLNIKQIRLVSTQANWLNLDTPKNKLKAYINFFGPGVITAKNIEFPSSIAPVYQDLFIATASNTGTFKATLLIEYIDPTNMNFLNSNLTQETSNELDLQNVPKPVKQVNYSIQKSSINPAAEYISLELWTDGSIYPDKALSYALEQLTKLFYDFTSLTNSLEPYSINN